MKIVVLTFREHDEQVITAKIEKTSLQYEDEYTLKSAQTCCTSSSSGLLIVVTLTFGLYDDNSEDYGG